MSMQPSLITMKTLTASKKALHLQEIKRSHRQVACKRRHRSKVQGKKVGALHFLSPHSFATHLHIHLPLKMERMLPVLFGEPVYVKNSAEKLELFTYKATSTMAPCLLFSTQNPHIHVIQRCPSVPSDSVLFDLVTLTCFSPLLHLLSLITNSDTVI